MKINYHGIGLLTAVALFSTPALAEKMKQEGVITSVSQSGLSVRTRQGPLHVVVTPSTTIKEVNGLSKKARDAKTLIPGLIIKAEGDQQGETLTAAAIEFKKQDWRSAVATKAGTNEQFERAAAERAELRQAIIDGQEYVIQDEKTVYFPVGSATISTEQKGMLHALATKAPQFGNYRVSILGFADPTGNAAANERLSLRRAMAVSNYLRQSGGIQPGRVLSPSAMGEGTAAPGEAMPTSNNQARRVVVRVVTPKGQLK